MNAPTNTNIASSIAEAQARFTADNPKSKAQLDKARKSLALSNCALLFGLSAVNRA